MSGELAVLFGALIGGVAAIYGVILSSWMQDRAEVARRKATMMEDRLSLSGALYGELAAIQTSLEDKYSILSQLTNTDSINLAITRSVHTRLSLPPSVVFQAVASNIGILGAETAKEIARIYAYKETVEGMLMSCRNNLLSGTADSKVMIKCSEEVKEFSIDIDNLINREERLSLFLK